MAKTVIDLTPKTLRKKTSVTVLKFKGDFAKLNATESRAMEDVVKGACCSVDRIQYSATKDPVIKVMLSADDQPASDHPAIIGKVFCATQEVKNDLEQALANGDLLVQGKAAKTVQFHMRRNEKPKRMSDEAARMLVLTKRQRSVESLRQHSALNTDVVRHSTSVKEGLSPVGVNLEEGLSEGVPTSAAAAPGSAE